MSMQSTPGELARHDGATRPAPVAQIYCPGGTPRVLVLERDRHMGNLLQEWLVAAGYDPVLASGESSASAVNIGRVDVVLADISSPRPAASALVVLLRASFPGTPIVLMSGYFMASGAQSRKVARALGVAGVLPKPFTRGALLGILARLVARQ